MRIFLKVLTGFRHEQHHHTRGELSIELCYSCQLSFRLPSGDEQLHIACAGDRNFTPMCRGSRSGKFLNEIFAIRKVYEYLEVSDCTEERENVPSFCKAVE